MAAFKIFLVSFLVFGLIGIIMALLGMAAFDWQQRQIVVAILLFTLIGAGRGFYGVIKFQKMMKEFKERNNLE